MSHAQAAAKAAAPPSPEDRERLLRSLIREIPGFPRPGIAFKDITPLLADAQALELAVEGLAQMAAPLQVDCVLAAEARGFLLGPAVALRLGAGFALARKPGKLPHRVIAADYQLEYGSDRLELHADALRKGARVLVHDDLLATGGTAKALCDLAIAAGGVVAGCGFLVELAFLRGRERLVPHEAHSLLRYDA
jgi:adenine phosphoribosyltransferase